MTKPYTSESNKPHLDFPLSSSNATYHVELDGEVVEPCGPRCSESWMVEQTGWVPRPKADGSCWWSRIFGKGEDRGEACYAAGGDDLETHRIVARDLEGALVKKINEEGFCVQINVGPGGSATVLISADQGAEYADSYGACLLEALIKVVKHLKIGPYEKDAEDE